ncbi:hypothetical protein WKI71_04480 [Streptomyces sp. MS1.AVA.1]|uniref:Secreted protein n=1 Tax=Streptomyces machairae TaxID=3134109 RepID=A0ABU8UGQ2_9ACTN
MRAPGTSTRTVTPSAASTGSVPALTSVVSTLWAPPGSSSEAVERAGRSVRALPWAAGWTVSANTWREALFGSGRCVTGSVTATASRLASHHTSADPMPTRCSSFVPSGPYRYGAEREPPA